MDRQHFRQMMGQAVGLQQRGDFSAAEGVYLELLRQMPNQADALHYLGLLKHQTGKSAEGIALMKKSVEAGVPNAGYMHNIGNALMQQGQLAEAIVYFRNAIELSPSYTEALNNLGETYTRLKMPFKACQYFRKAYQIEPSIPEIGLNFVRSLYNTGELSEAIEICKRCLQTAPDDIEFTYLMVSCLWDSAKTEDALQHLRTAISRNPLSAILQHAMGTFMAELGKFDEARQFFDNALIRDPLYYQAYLAQSAIHTSTSNDPMVPLLEGKLRTTKTQETPLGDIALHFSLGKLLQDQEQYDRAFTHYKEGNKIMRRLITYSSSASKDYVDGLIKYLGTDFLNKFNSCGIETETPIFILGMSRSGTSLIEQVLSAHPQVTAGGELPYLPQSMLQQVESMIPGTQGEKIAALSHEQLCSIGHRYLDKITTYYPNAPRVTDKLPGNFMLVGLIKTLFPHAHIIHCERDPLDTCLSCYTTFFQMGHEFTYDLVELGEYYQLYRKMMHHWAMMINPDSFLTVKYEDFVTDIETGTRRILDFCGMEWSSACLEFNRSGRNVKTASFYQVRQPVHSRSIGRWKNYADHLEPLQKVLEAGNLNNGVETSAN
jgi:tetratricopeptide (TPR) repeat protein